MKHYLAMLAVFCMIGIMSKTSLYAQSENAKNPAATLSIQKEIQTATNDLNAALLRGDAQSVLHFLAADFEFGHHQYRKRDAAWMRRVLPGQLKVARFTKLDATLSNVDFTGTQAVARGRIEAITSSKEGKQGTHISGNYGAIWIKTNAGWRLKRADLVFDALMKASFPVEPPAIVRLPDASTNKTTLPRENPVVVLDQSHRGDVKPLAFAPDGAVLASNDFYDGLRFASARTGAFLKAMRTPMSINSMTYAPNGTLITGHNDGKVRLWDVEKGTLLRELAVSKWSVYSVCVSPDGHTLAADGAGSVQLWDIASGRKLQTFGDTGGNVHTLDFSPDGTMLVFGARQGIELWDVQKRKLMRTIKYEQWGGFLPDGKTMITVANGKLHFRNVKSGIVKREVSIPNPLRPSKPYPNFIFSGFIYEPGAAIAPNGKIAASIYSDGSIGVWDTRTRTLLHLLRGFQSDAMGGDISALTFSPNSAAIAAGSRSGEIAIWHVLPPETPPDN